MPYFYEFWQENPLSKRDASGILGETLYDGRVWRAPGNGKQAGAFRGGRAGDRKRTCKGWRIYFMKMLEDHRDGKNMNEKTDDSRKIWTVYIFLVWYDRFFEHGKPVHPSMTAGK